MLPDDSRDVLASLGGILDASNSYRRVIEAELALEALGELKRRKVEHSADSYAAHE